MRPCRFCSGDASAPNHRLRCDGQQGWVEARLPLFDREAGRDARDAALVEVEAHAVPAFVEAALDAVRRVALRQARLTTDDVWRELGAEAPGTHERRAMGPVMMKARALGYVRPLETVLQSAMVSCHARPKRVWQSLLYRQAQAS